MTGSAKQSIPQLAGTWIASSLALLAMTNSIDRVIQHHLDQLRAGTLERVRQLRLQLRGIGDPDRLQPERFRHAGEIHRRIDEIHADIIVVAVEGKQALLDDAVAAI